MPYVSVGFDDHLFWEGKASNYNFLVDLSNFNFNFSILFQFDFSFGVYACDSELHINR